MNEPPILNGQRLHDLARTHRRIADACTQLAPRLDHMLDHVRDETRIADGYPTATMSDGMPRGTAALTIVERAADTRSRLTGARENIRDDIDYLDAKALDVASTIAAVGQIITNTIGTRMPRMDNSAHRCNGKIHADCTNIASDHHDQDGTTVEGICDDCWTASCPTCHARSVPQYRTQCDPCRKKAARNAA